MYSIYIFVAFNIILFTVHRSWCVKNVHANEEGKHNQLPWGGGGGGGGGEPAALDF